MNEDRPSDLGIVSFRWPNVVTAGLLATGAPLLLLMANSDWFFTREGYLDPWNYVGLFREYLDPDYLPEDYKLARLPWILPGFLVTRLFPPVPAAYVLHAAFLCATSLMLFTAIYVLFRRPALAAVLAMCLGFYTHAHGSGGWDYHNTGVGAYYLATLVLFVLPLTIDGHRALFLAAGGMAALTVHTNITFVNLFPALAYVHLRVVHLQRRGGLPRVHVLLVRAAWVLVGVVLATALLGLVNWMVGRDFLFFRRLVNLVTLYVTDARFQAGRPLWNFGWVLTARHLAFPMAVFLAGAASLAVGRRSPAYPAERVGDALIVQFLAMMLLWATWQAAGHTALDWDYMSYALIPSCLVAVGGILLRGWPAWCERHWVATILATAIVLTVCLTVERIPGIQRVAALVAPAILLAGCLLFLLGFAAYLWRPSAVSALAVVVTFALGNRLVAPGYPDYFASDPCKVQPSVYAAIVDAASWLDRLDPLFNRVHTWFDENELLRPADACVVRLGHMANSITTMAFVPYVTRAFPMPGVEAVPDDAVVALTQGNRVLVIISDAPEPLEAWRRRLVAMGLGHTEIAMHHVPVLASGFTMHAWSVGPDSR